MNRAIQGRYNVGSTFKPFTAYAAINYVFPTDVQLGDLRRPRTGSTFITNPLIDTYLDTGTYDDPVGVLQQGRRVCAASSTTPVNKTLGDWTHYGEVNLSDALAVSSDAFYYRIGAEMFLSGASLPEPQPILQDELQVVRLRAEDRASTCPTSTGASSPTPRSRRSSPTRAPSRSPRAAASSSATACRWRSARASTRSRHCSSPTPTPPTPTVGSSCESAHRLRAIFEPSVPDSEQPGYADIFNGGHRQGVHARGAFGCRDEPADKVGPIYDGLNRVINEPIVARPSAHGLHDVPGLFDRQDLPSGKTGTAQGKENLPENDSSVFAAFEHDRPLDGYTVSAYLEKAGYGKQAAAPLVRCMFQALRGQVQADPVEFSDQLDINQVAPAPPNLLSDPNCLQGRHGHEPGRTVSFTLQAPSSGTALGNIRSSPSDSRAATWDWILMLATFGARDRSAWWPSTRHHGRCCWPRAWTPTPTPSARSCSSSPAPSSWRR